MTFKSKGFTFIEIVIVLVIVGLLAYIALPNIMRAHISVKERALRESLIAFSIANEVFRKSQNPPQYAVNMTELTEPGPNGARYLDISWKENVRNGFHLAYSGGGKDYPDSFALLAVSQGEIPGVQETYCIDQKGLAVKSIKGVKAPLGTPGGCKGGEAVVG